ncbi:MAG: phosphatidate cytidylyltransferase [Rikenellaceae bacterium]
MLSNLLNKNFIVRCASGIVVVATLLCATLYNEISNYVLFAIIGLMSHNEIAKNLLPKDIKSNRWLALAMSFVILLTFGACKFDFLDNFVLYTVIVLVVLTRFVVEMFKANVNPIHNISYDLFSIIYAVVPMILLTMLPPRLVVAVLFIIWMNDIGAYVIGVVFGKHRLCVRLSPKKSIEGFFGGIIAAVGLAYFTSSFAEGFSTMAWCGMAVLISVSGVCGDLFESMIKRSVEVKDSGNSIPGHGGFLDRFDALIIAAPIVWAIYFLINNKIDF